MNTEYPFLLFLGDIHGEYQKIARIGDIQKAQALVITGDIGRYGTRAEALRILEYIEQFNTVYFAQIGNIDSLGVDILLTEKQINLHKNIMYYQDVMLMGLGGSLPTPFGTKSEFSEQFYKSVLEEFALQRKEKLTVLVSHNPPYNTKCDTITKGTHIGSKAVLDFIHGFQPDFCVCGHVHEARGQDVIGKTQVYNLGDFASGYYGKLYLAPEPVMELCSL